MKITEIMENQGLSNVLAGILERMHKRGPIEIQDFETLAYAKRFQPEVFRPFEKTLISLMGLFYKAAEPETLMEEIYSIYADAIESDVGLKFTPVQADAFRKINENVYFSFSAPTSAGKSYLFREIIKRADGDIVIVVPSRALIAEYVNLLNEIVGNDVLVLQFIEIVNTLHSSRRIYVITPERGVELFKHISRLNLNFFLFDEAQVSEEAVRGMKFDSLVRRVDKVLPTAKKVFTHPFVINPDAQLLKHNFQDSSDHYCYKHNAVGKIYMSVDDGQFKYFSPFQVGTKIESVIAQEDVISKTLQNNGTVLIYTSKNKIYEGGFLLDFQKYINLCSKLTDPKAIECIEELRKFIGASNKGKEKHSQLIEMMQHGIVIHHGSIPLKARLLIESFVNSNFAKICFSTSTLIQGINMPFDVVWIDNFKFTGSESSKNLALKNLIGRAGRSSQKIANFDYGFVVISGRNLKSFKARMLAVADLDPQSQLDRADTNVDIDLVDIVQAIRNDTFNDDLHLTNTQVNRLERAQIDDDIQLILNNLLFENQAIKGRQYYNLSSSLRVKIKTAFQNIFIAHLRRTELTLAEKKILSASIPIMLWQIQGKSFAEIVSLRHSYLTNKTERRAILRRLKSGLINAEEAQRLNSEIKIKFSPLAGQLPNKTVKAPPLFPATEDPENLEYDLLVYDTYDYLDKVIGLSLTDPLTAAFEMYYTKTNDSRAITMRNYVKYGTNDEVEIWLLKYGFGFDDIEWIIEHVEKIDEREIVFKSSVSTLSARQSLVLRRFL